MKSNAAFEQGSIVKLTNRFAKVLDKTNRGQVRWLGRTGMVVHCGKIQVSVIWQGRASLDFVPIKGLRQAVIKAPVPVPVPEPA